MVCPEVTMTVTEIMCNITCMGGGNCVSISASYLYNNNMLVVLNFELGKRSPASLLHCSKFQVSYTWEMNTLWKGKSKHVMSLKGSQPHGVLFLYLPWGTETAWRPL